MVLSYMLTTVLVAMVYNTSGMDGLPMILNPRELALESVVFTGQKIGELMTTSMDPEQAKAWFGAAPPDLTLEARLRSPEGSTII